MKKMMAILACVLGMMGAPCMAADAHSGSVVCDGNLQSLYSDLAVVYCLVSEVAFDGTSITIRLKKGGGFVITTADESAGKDVFDELQKVCPRNFDFETNPFSPVSPGKQITAKYGYSGDTTGRAKISFPVRVVQIPVSS